ncbi:hypothetical protein BDM02DRAFT_3188737 [Thelephora ganbajun]|uniref:Uncharacterized protein n=1 Tax=Thelephora ganbajun TaxID=370292 RepID=A0ACB6ZB67_THEGA|nr:hypothetical protein BDM02DRAFT_3188737 [Thelephora ganbajun]
MSFLRPHSWSRSSVTLKAILRFTRELSSFKLSTTDSFSTHSPTLLTPCLLVSSPAPPNTENQFPEETSSVVLVMMRETVYYFERLPYHQRSHYCSHYLRSRQKTTGECNTLIFDPGGGTLDNPFLTTEERIFYAKAITNDTWVVRTLTSSSDARMRRTLPPSLMPPAASLPPVSVPSILSSAPPTSIKFDSVLLI